MRRFSFLGLLPAIAAAGACSLLNAPDDVLPGTGGHATTSSSSSGAGGTCKVDGDCPASDVPCNRYACVLGGVCQLVQLADGLTCEDGAYCTVNKTCLHGQCEGAPRGCPLTDACNTAVCDEHTKQCTVLPTGDGKACDDGDPCTGDGTCLAGVCEKGADACAALATDCLDATCTPTGCATKSKLDGTFCGQTFCSNGQCSGGHCNLVPINEGQGCDDTLFCTVGDVCTKGHCVGSARVCPTGNQCIKGTCDEANHMCVSTAIANNAACDDGDACTAGEFCSNQACIGGIAPSTYFAETFAAGAAGWTLGTEWQVGHAQMSFGGQDGDDPGFDRSGEGQVAGVALGGFAKVAFPDPTHGLYYLTSPAFSTNFAGAVYLTFYRWLNTDYQPYMRDTIEVSSDGGSSWQVIWENPVMIPINDDAWTFQSLDISTWKGVATRVRWGFSIGLPGVYDEGSWNLDSIKVQNAPCPN
jgi:hypothetical protein